MLPDLPPNAEAQISRMAQRVYLRRWLLTLCAAIIAIFVALYQLPLAPALMGFGSMLAGAALLPREGVMKPVELNVRTLGVPESKLVTGMLEALPAPAIMLSAQGEVLGFNSPAREFFPALRRGQLLSSVLRDPGILEGIASASPQKRPTQLVQYEQRVPIERHMDVTISWIGPVSGRSPERRPAILLSLRDLTDKERLDQLRTDFVANASHELRTPLASLLGFIETLQGAARNDTAARDQFLEIMAAQARRMARLIDNLLSLNRIEMRMHLKPQDQVDLAEIAEHAATTLEPLAESSNIAIHLQLPEEAAWVTGDWDELVQVVSNLMENAVKYGRSGGNVWLAVARTPEGQPRGWSIAVRDDGPGIDKKHLPRLTERFYRANDAGGEKSGTGLGLAIVKHVVTRHRGELQIASELGQGSAFTITLAEAAAGPDAAASGRYGAPG